MKPRRNKARTAFRLSGAVMLLSVFLLLLAAWNTGINLLYLVFGGMLSLVLVSVYVSRRNLAGLRVTVEAPRAVNRGEPFKIRVRLENHKRFMSSFSLRIETIDALEEAAAYVLALPAKMAAHVSISQRYMRRGVYPLPRIRVVSAFPFGFFVRQLELDVEGEVVVYPRVRAIRPGAIQPVALRHQAPRIVRGEGDEYFSLRDYRPGDDLRQVAWRASAKRGNLMVREFARQTTRSVVIAVDLRWVDRPDFEEWFEECMELAASIAISLLNQHYKIAIVTPEGGIPLSDGSEQGHKALELLARAAADPEAPASFAWLSDRTLNGAGIVCLSPDRSKWGRSAYHQWRVLHPREVLRA